MNSVTAETVMQKFEVLPENAKKEVDDFIDFLLQKRPPRKKKLDKKKLLEISQWTEEDIKAVEEAGKEINKRRRDIFIPSERKPGYRNKGSFHCGNGIIP
jgi:hypothetical protein